MSAENEKEKIHALNYGATDGFSGSHRERVLNAQMAVASAVEDHSDAMLHAFIALLVDLEYMTEPDVLKALEKFDESLQASSTTEP